MPSCPQAAVEEPTPRASWVLLAAMTAAVFWPVLTHDFVRLDDDLYVTGNPRVQEGFTPAALAWAFATNHHGNWYPLTLASHALDVQLFGLAPWGHHLTSLLIHAANALLLFSLLGRLSKDAWRGAFVAAVFAVHPLQVESVAWVAERKNLLSTLFCLLTLRAYAAHAQRPSAGRYAAVLAWFAAALMAKASAVTLPCLMLVLDYWPLERWRRGWKPLLREKAPLFAMAAAAGAVTLLFSRLSPLAALPLSSRVAHALVSCSAYLRQALWPADLAVYYPHPGRSPGPVPTLAAAAVLGGLSLAVVRARRGHPALLAGWLWFLAALAPFLGVIKVGHQAMADHYAYVPLIGLAVMAAWVPAPSGRLRPGAAAAVAACLLAAAMVAAGLQVRYWRNSVTLLERALLVEEANPVVHNNLGFSLYERGDTAGALRHYRRALELLPAYADAENNLGIVLAEQGDLAEAAARFERAAAIDPGLAVARGNLAKTRALLAARRPRPGGSGLWRGREVR
ncbi:MAG: tetratricopeptide repeat protein [Elusimicrobia bacterium]|nr:tetratricopeptide repeat protein [Elusimicrobiota bacterium]